MMQFVARFLGTSNNDGLFRFHGLDEFPNRLTIRSTFEINEFDAGVTSQSFSGTDTFGGAFC